MTKKEYENYSDMTGQLHGNAHTLQWPEMLVDLWGDSSERAVCTKEQGH